MSEVLYSVLVFVIIFCFLTYSCQWFGRSLKKYQDARREFEEEQAREARRGHPDPRYAVYTIERGGQTTINYRSDIPPPRSHPQFLMVDLPPKYEDALRMEQFPVETPTNSSNTAVLPQRRYSASI